MNNSISFVVPCHNYGMFLNGCLDSILAQKALGGESEILVIDDGSKPPIRLDKEYRKRVKIVRTKYYNIHDVRREGYRLTSGEVLCFVDADDELTDLYASVGMSYFFFPEIGVVYSDIQCFGDSNAVWRQGAFSHHRLKESNYIHAGSLVRREALKTSGRMQQKSPNQTWADWWLWLGVVEAGWSAIRQPEMYRYRIHKNSMMQTHIREHGDKADPYAIFDEIP